MYGPLAGMLGPLGRAARKPPSALYSSLVAYWAMEGASGASEADLVGSNTLTQNNTVGSAAGKVGNCRTFTAASSQYLSVADTVAFRVAGGFWAAGWAKPGALGNPRCWLAKGITSHYEYFAEYNAATAHFAITLMNAGGSGIGIATSSVVASPGSWHFPVVYYDFSTPQVGVSVNGGSFVTAVPTATPVNGASALNVGRAPDNTEYWDGSIDEVMFGRGYVPTTTDLAFLYNSGTGRSFTELQSYRTFDIRLWDLLSRFGKRLGRKPPRWAVNYLPRIPRALRGRRALAC